jgi:hypothetical protein
MRGCLGAPKTLTPYVSATVAAAVAAIRQACERPNVFIVASPNFEDARIMYFRGDQGHSAEAL